MIKKISAMILSAALCLLSITVFAAASFTDLDSAHWAYPVVSTLVDEGTINGYEDGSFRPDGLVTRAEFVKMIGKGTGDAVSFSDVSSDHWAYDYITYSGLEASYGDVFEPDRAITRGETAPLLWHRAGSPDAGGVSDTIINQSGKYDKKAIAWVYKSGIIVGNDGVSLRLDDTLTRAEAAALIIKSRKAAEQSVTTAPALDEYVYNSFKMFDAEYSEKATISNGEMARAALRLASREIDMTYASFVSANPSFEHEYATDLTIMYKYTGMDESRLNAEFADKPVTIGDAVKMLKMAFSRRSSSVFNEEAVYSGSENDPLTHKTVASILAQYNKIVGIQTAMLTTHNENNKFVSENVKIKTDMGSMPSNYGKFQSVIEGVPNAVYEYDLGTAIPKETYEFGLDYLELFVKKCTKLVEGAKSKHGVDMYVTCYPTLIYDNGSGFAMRIKCSVTGVSGNVTPAQMFDGAITNRDTVLKAGSEFFADIQFGTYMVSEE